MSVLRRLGNVAKGKMLEWQREASRPDTDPVLAEEPTRRPRPPRDDDEVEAEERVERDPPPRAPIPGPRKRRL